MKKTIFMLMAAAAISFASCGGNNEAAPAEDSTAVDTAAVEFPNLDGADAATVKASLESKVQELIANGDVEAAKQYAYQLEKWYAENKESLDKIAEDGLNVEELINTCKNLPATTEALGESAKEAAKADAQKVGEEAKQEAKTAANDAAQQATQKAAEKASEGINKGINKAFGK